MKRIKLKHGTARVDENISDKTIEALNELSELAYNHEPKPDGYALLCAGLGKKQKEVIKHLLEGKHIYVMQDLSRMSQIQHITDENKDDYYEITEPIIRSLTNRNLLDIKKVYSTVQPDTEHYEMRLKSEMVELARMACT